MAAHLNRLSALKITKAMLPGMYADGGGLYLQVGNGGARSWVFRFRYGGKRRDMGLGPDHALSLANARQLVFECRCLLLDGIDPIASRRTKRLQCCGRVSFREAFETFFAVKKGSLSNAKHLKQ